MAYYTSLRGPQSPGMNEGRNELTGLVNSTDVRVNELLSILLHVLCSYLPERCYLIYNLRERSHNRSLITKTTYLDEHDFFIWILYKKLLLIDPFMSCVAVIALSLAILLLCFITYIAFCCLFAFVNS